MDLWQSKLISVNTQYMDKTLNCKNPMKENKHQIQSEFLFFNATHTYWNVIFDNTMH